MNRAEKEAALKQIWEEKEGIYQKMLYYRRKIDHLNAHSTTYVDAEGQSQKRLEYWNKIKELSDRDKELDIKRSKIRQEEIILEPIFTPLQSKIRKGEGIEAGTSQVEFAASQKTKSKTLLSRKEERKLAKKKAAKGKRKYGLEAFGMEKERQSSLNKFFVNPIRYLLGNPQLTFDDISEKKPIEKVHKHLEEREIKPEPEKSAEKSWEFKPNAGLINKHLAERSHMGTSWDPEKRAEQEISGFVQNVQNIYDNLKRYAKTDAQKTLLIEEMQKFQAGYAGKYNEKLAAHGRTISSFITGGSKFPTRRAEKANAAYDKRFQEMLDWKDRAEKAIIRKLKGEAVEEAGGEVPLLEKKLKEHEKLQEMMVEANKIIRKKAEPGVEGVSKHKQLVNLGFSETKAAELLKPDFVGRLGFTYHLQNNNQEIHRLRDRIAQLQRKETTETREFEFSGGSIKDNQEDDRVQIFFDKKPAQDIISKLKNEGWHWTPSVGAWQRKRTEYAVMSANRITGAQAETQFGGKVLRANPRDVIGSPPNFVMKLQLFKLWKDVLGAEDIGDFETFMKEAADLTYDEAKEKLLKTYGEPKQMTSGYLSAKASDAEARIRAGMCDSASEECDKGDPEACRVACEECGIVDLCPPKKESTWRKFPDHKSETRAVKDALKKAGIEAEVKHGTGTAWGWLDINIGDPRKRDGLKPAPFGYQYTDEEQALQKKALKIAQEITGRHGDYDGRISVLAQEWRHKVRPAKEKPVEAAAKPEPEVKPEPKEIVKPVVHHVKPVVQDRRLAQSLADVTGMPVALAPAQEPVQKPRKSPGKAVQPQTKAKPSTVIKKIPRSGIVRLTEKDMKGTIMLTW